MLMRPPAPPAPPSSPRPPAPPRPLRSSSARARPRIVKGVTVHVLAGPFEGKTGVAQELDGKGGARVVLGTMSSLRVPLADLTRDTSGRERPPFRSSHRKPGDSDGVRPELPSTLSGQFRRHLPAYVAGTVVLATFQVAMNQIDWLSKSAVDTIFGATPREAWRPAAKIFALAVVAFTARVASRWFMFNAGRDVEYEVRTTLFGRLHRLGAAFYRTMSAGEIMRRSTNDLPQVRMLFGFGVLNIVNVVFAFASALQVMLSISGRLSLAAFVTMPILIVVTRSFSRGLFARNRENQRAMGGSATCCSRTSRACASSAASPSRRRSSGASRSPTRRTSTRASASRGCAGRWAR